MNQKLGRKYELEYDYRAIFRNPCIYYKAYGEGGICAKSSRTKNDTYLYVIFQSTYH